MEQIAYLKKYYKGDLEEAIKRLENGEPVQYIVGDVDFCGNTIKVNKNVLIPRFETEELVMKTYNYIKDFFKKENISLVDLGTGSGCIAITMKKLLPNSKVSAVDISKEALDVAIDNASNLDINFYLGNMLEPLNEKFDCIISNPPYIAYDEEIMDIVKNNEPHKALYASNNGLAYYEDILKKATNYLNKKFLIAFEIGESQSEAIKVLANKYLIDVKIIQEKDMQKRDRFIFIFHDLCDGVHKL